MISESVILAIIGAISAIGVAWVTYHQKSTLGKLNDKQNTEELLHDERLKIRELERLKDDKMERSIMANHDLTAEISRHLIEGNHMDLLKEKCAKIIESDKEFEEAREQLRDAYYKYQEHMLYYQDKKK